MMKYSVFIFLAIFHCKSSLVQSSLNPCKSTVFWDCDDGIASMKAPDDNILEFFGLDFTVNVTFDPSIETVKIEKVRDKKVNIVNIQGAQIKEVVIKDLKALNLSSICVLLESLPLLTSLTISKVTLNRFQDRQLCHLPRGASRKKLVVTESHINVDRRDISTSLEPDLAFDLNNFELFSMMNVVITGVRFLELHNADKGLDKAEFLEVSLECSIPRVCDRKDEKIEPQKVLLNDPRNNFKAISQANSLCNFNYKFSFFLIIASTICQMWKEA